YLYLYFLFLLSFPTRRSSDLILLICHVIITFLALAIFSSVFRKNRKKGSIFLVFLIAIGIMNMDNLSDYSITLGILCCLVYLILGLITYLSLKSKITDRTSL